MQTCIIWVAVLVLIAACCFCSYQVLEEIPAPYFEACGIIIAGLIVLLGGLAIWKRSPWDEGGWE